MSELSVVEQRHLPERVDADGRRRHDPGADELRRAELAVRRPAGHCNVLETVDLPRDGGRSVVGDCHRDVLLRRAVGIELVGGGPLPARPPGRDADGPVSPHILRPRGDGVAPVGHRRNRSGVGDQGGRKHMAGREPCGRGARGGKHRREPRRRTTRRTDSASREHRRSRPPRALGGGCLGLCGALRGHLLERALVVVRHDLHELGRTVSQRRARARRPGSRCARRARRSGRAARTRRARRAPRTPTSSVLQRSRKPPSSSST